MGSFEETHRICLALFQKGNTTPFLDNQKEKVKKKKKKKRDKEETV